jgi:membrane-bound lytic murein transglycosylase D
MNPRKVYWLSAAIGFGSAVVAIVIFSFVQNQRPGKEENDAYREVISEKYRIYSLPIPEKVDFAGEVVPIDNQDVREKFDRELLINTYWHSNTLLCIKRAHRWFPVIEPILAANGIPDDFKYLALIESGYMNVISPAGATGFWQFLAETGKGYGLEINDQVDERYHVEKSTQAACHYLKDAYDQYGSWSLAAASYNMGIAGPRRQIDRQKETTYWDLMLNEETSRYVFRIIAMKEIINNADKYGFVIRPADLYEPLRYNTVSVDSSITDFATFAKSHNTSYKDLKMLNPWLRESYLKNKEKRVYEIKIPVQQ